MGSRLFRSSPVRAAITAAALYLAPLLGSPTLGTAAPWIGAIVTWLTLASQPPVRGPALWSRRSPDRRSALVIFVTMLFTQLAAILEYRLSRGLVPIAFPVAIGGGAAMAGVGLAVRLRAIRTLGTHFTSTVQVEESQSLIRSGPYASVRHPSYSGALLATAGILLALRSAIGVALFLLAVIPAYHYRIRIEECALLDALGATYRDYRRDVPALIPSARTGNKSRSGRQSRASSNATRRWR